MSSIESFVLGVLITIVVAILAPFTTNPLQEWWKTRNQNQRLRTIAVLEREYSTVEDYRNDSQKLLRFLGARILFLTVWWIFQGFLDVVFGFIVNGFSVARQTFSYAIFPINTNTVSNWVSAVASLVDAIILAVLFRIGVRSYRIVHNVIHFDEYEGRVKTKIAAIKERDKLSEKES